MEKLLIILYPQKSMGNGTVAEGILDRMEASLSEFRNVLVVGKKRRSLWQGGTFINPLLLPKLVYTNTVYLYPDDLREISRAEIHLFQEVHIAGFCDAVEFVNLVYNLRRLVPKVMVVKDSLGFYPSDAFYLAVEKLASMGISTPILTLGDHVNVEDTLEHTGSFPDGNEDPVAAAPEASREDSQST